LPKDLHKNITKNYATHWREIGVLLNLDNPKLDIIKADNPNNVVRCCDVMLSEWLRLDLSATWKKLFDVIDDINSC